MKKAIKYIIKSIIIGVTTIILFNLVVTISAGNLYAIAHLGVLTVYPIKSYKSNSLTLITTPSVS